MAAVNKKLKFVILQQVNVISLLLLQILAAIENYQYSRMKILHMNCQIIHLKSVHLKHACEVVILFFLNKQGIHFCVASNFHPGLEKISI